MGPPVSHESVVIPSTATTPHAADPTAGSADRGMVVTMVWLAVSMLAGNEAVCFQPDPSQLSRRAPALATVRRLSSPNDPSHFQSPPGTHGAPVVELLSVSNPTPSSGSEGSDSVSRTAVTLVPPATRASWS